MPDFLTLIDQLSPTKGFKEGLTKLLDGMLNTGKLTPAQQEQIARLRASTQIVLQDF